MILRVPAALAAALLLALAPARANDPITAVDLQEHIDVLASDLLAGRETGTTGELRAAAYLVSILEELPGIEPDGPDGGWFQEFPVPSHDDVESGRNVLARLPGSDPGLAHQAIVLGAHYDHVGLGEHGNTLALDAVGQIHNGADDNASGSSGLLEIAAALATSDTPPRRTILFQWYSGEELGLLGSRHWVAEPTHPLGDVIAMLNCDMIGRPLGSTIMVGGTGTAPRWPELLRRLAEPLQLELVLDATGIAPSDNSSFYEHDIPVLFFFSGVHEDYHRPGDDAHKIHAEPAARVVQLVHDVLRAVDARDDPPRFVEALGAVNYFTPKVRFGMELDPVGPGVPGTASIAVLDPDSPAGRAGLREGDVIFRVDNREPADVAALTDMLDTTDHARSPRRFVVWRPRDGVPTPPPDDPFPGTWTEWNARWEWLEVPVRPVVR